MGDVDLACVKATANCEHKQRFVCPAPFRKPRFGLSFGIGALAALLALAADPRPAVAQAPPSAPLTQKAPDAASLVAAAEQNGYVPVIVEFANPIPPSQMSPSPAVLSRARSQIAATQDAIISTHFGSVANPTRAQGFERSLHLMDISPMFALNVTRAELEALAADPRVERVHVNGLSRPVLIDSVPLIGGVLGYSLGATGASQAVAILDTGVQSNHEFLLGKVIVEACFSNGGGGANRVTLCPNGTNAQTGAGAASALTANCISGSTQLCEHGTHVAGIAAGFNTSPNSGEPANGVAKSAMIVAVQIFTRFNSSADCGSPTPCVLTWTSDIISALDWLYANALTPASGVSLASVNMSLGGGSNAGTCDGDSRKGPIDSCWEQASLPSLPLATMASPMP